MKYWEIIDKYRQIKGYSWYRIAKLSKVPVSTINNGRMNNNCLSFENTCLMASVLDIDLNELNNFIK